jgi:Domain of unknown function (DUF4387)
MPRLGEVCRHIRSKNAGPFWITVDLFFRDADSYRSYKDDPNISARTFAERFNADESLVKVVRVDSLMVVKVSYPRPNPQGWQGERDMHAGQQYVSLLDLELAA